jgi:hypothetical protein
MPNFELNFDAYLNHEDYRPPIVRGLLDTLDEVSAGNKTLSPVRAGDTYNYIRALETRCLALYWQMFRMMEGYKRMEAMTHAIVKLEADENLIRSFGNSKVLEKLATTSVEDLKKEAEARVADLPDITEFEGRPGAL